jgi:hypothetical protein
MHKAQSDGSGHCADCGDVLHRVPGGHGAILVHSDGYVVGIDQRCPLCGARTTRACDPTDVRNAPGAAS